eukprot:4943540-Amphidinium_carterae.1
MTKEYYNSLLSVYNIKENTNSLSTTSTKRPLARNKEDPEAEKKYEFYLEENKKLEKNLQEEYDKEHGPFEDAEEYQKALEDKDHDAIKRIIFKYAAGIRERKLQWREFKINEQNQQREAWKKEVLREQAEKAAEEQRRVQSTTASSTDDTMTRPTTPPRPQRQAPLPSYLKVPQTPAPQQDPLQL